MQLPRRAVLVQLGHENARQRHLCRRSRRTEPESRIPSLAAVRDSRVALQIPGVVLLLKGAPSAGLGSDIQPGFEQAGGAQVGDHAILDRAAVGEQRIVEIEQNDRDHGGRRRAPSGFAGSVNARVPRLGRGRPPPSFAPARVQRGALARIDEPGLAGRRGLGSRASDLAADAAFPEQVVTVGSAKTATPSPEREPRLTRHLDQSAVFPGITSTARRPRSTEISSRYRRDRPPACSRCRGAAPSQKPMSLPRVRLPITPISSPSRRIAQVYSVSSSHHWRPLADEPLGIAPLVGPRRQHEVLEHRVLAVLRHHIDVVESRLVEHESLGPERDRLHGRRMRPIRS